MNIGFCVEIIFGTQSFVSNLIGRNFYKHWHKLFILKFVNIKLKMYSKNFFILQNLDK